MTPDERGTMNDDAELLRRYVRSGDEAAFAEVVRRHVDLVHSAALRQVNGDAHRARDVTQQVFADLARKASAVAGERVLAGWLFVSTRYAAAKLVRGERRRQVREQEAHMMQEISQDDAARLDWERVRPVLDEALSELKETEREAILLRFFEGRGFADVGERLRLSENTARMRVERALDKLHGLLVRRGVTSTSGALAVVLANQAVVAAPAGLAASVSGMAVAGVLAGTGAVATTGFMTIGKFSAGILGGVLAGGAGGLLVQQANTLRLEEELGRLRQSSAHVLAAKTDARENGRAAELAEQRRSDAELDRLAVEAAALKMKLEMSQGIELHSRSLQATGKPGEARRYAPHELDRPPKPTYRKPPKYPADMRREGIEGEAVIRFVVNAEGGVSELGVVRSTHRSFEAPALDAIKAWRFEAGEKSGATVNVQMEMPIRFTLSKDSVQMENWF